MQIKDLKTHIGEETEMTVFLTETNETANKSGNRWRELIVCDCTGATSFKMWAESMDTNIDPNELVGSPVVVAGQIDLWQDRGGMNVVSIRKAEEGTYKMGDFFPSLDEKDRAYLTSRLDILIGQVGNEEIRSLLQVIFSESRQKKMMEKCGGTSHHLYLGGLLAHLVQTAEIAYKEADCQVVGPYRQKVNKDIVIAGALLHDVGKLTTLLDVPGKLSDRGFLVSNATESILFVNGFNLKQEAKVRNLAPIIHVIESCNTGKTRTQEAILVSHADKMSNRMDAFGLAFFDESSLERGGTISYSKENHAYMVRGGM